MNWMLAGIEHWNQVCVSSGRLWPFHFHRDGQGATHCDPGGKRWLASRDWWSWVAGLKLLIFGAQYGRGIPKNHMHSMVFPCGSTASWNDNGSAVTEKHNSKRQDGYLWPWRWDSFRAAWWNNGHPLTSAESSHRTTMNPAIEAAGKGLELHVFHEGLGSELKHVETTNWVEMRLCRNSVPSKSFKMDRHGFMMLFVSLIKVVCVCVCIEEMTRRVHSICYFWTQSTTTTKTKYFVASIPRAELQG